MDSLDYWTDALHSAEPSDTAPNNQLIITPCQAQVV